MSTKSINWKAETDAEKNACFAEWVAARKLPFEIRKEWEENHDCGSFQRDVVRDANALEVPDYLHSFDAVLPWLEKDGNEWSHNIVRYFFGEETHTRWARRIEILATKKSGMNHATIWVPQETPAPEAAMIALLRAKGIEVIT